MDLYAQQNVHTNLRRTNEMMMMIDDTADDVDDDDGDDDGDDGGDDGNDQDGDDDGEIPHVYPYLCTGSQRGYGNTCVRLHTCLPTCV